MNKEIYIIRSLASESERISLRDSPELSFLHSSLIKEASVSGWNNENFSFPSYNHQNPPQSLLPQGKKPENSSDLIEKKRNSFPSVESKSLSKRENTKAMFNPMPTLYKISKIDLNDKQIFLKEKNLKKLGKTKKLPILNKKNFISVYFPPKKKMNNFHKNLIASQISEVLDLLKPEIKNPVASLVTPQLRSKSVLYKSFNKRKTRNSGDFAYVSLINPELIK